MDSTNCPGCMDILRQPLQAEDDFIYFDKLQSTAKAGCQSCCIIKAAIARHYKWEQINNDIVVEHWVGLTGIILHESGQRTPRRILLGAYDKATADAWPMLTMLASKETPYSRSGSLHQLQIWLKNCNQYHPECYNKSPPVLPTRVIDIGSEDQSPFLHISSQNETGWYAALSHCWGTDSIGRLVTQKLNMKALEQEIPFEIIPKTFQETIAVARQLGIPYLWIDCLCIIQDDLEDWTRESARMCGIYENACLTIAADRASGPRDGLHLSETEIKRRNSNVNIQVPSGKSYNISAHLYDSTTPLIKGVDIRCHADDTVSHLEKRAWVLQETILSRRTIHFTGNELIWSCRHIRMCECLRKIYRTYDESQWEDLVANFTSRDITYDSDYLPALSGLAAARGLPSSDYLAGIWRQNIDTELLWQCDDNKSRRHPTYYAPSWSWASVIGGVSFWYAGHPKFNILAVSCTPATANAYGPASGAHIKIRGKLSRVREFRFRLGYSSATLISGQKLTFTPDIHSDNQELDDLNSAYFALFSEPGGDGDRYVFILRQRSPNVETVERIGLSKFSTGYGQCSVEDICEEVVTIV